MSFSTSRLVQAVVCLGIGAASLLAFAVDPVYERAWTLTGALPLLLAPALLYEWGVTREDDA